MKSKLILLVLFAGFLAIFACTNPIMEQARPKKGEKPTLTILQAYTVTFESNGGSPVDSQTVTEGEKADRPDNPTKVEDGIEFGFVNWYDNEECTDPPYDFETLVTSDITLYAGWSSTTYTVTFNSNGGSGVAPQAVGEGGIVTEPTPDPEKDGHVFGGWYSDSYLTDRYGFDTPVTENIDLYAKWLQIFTITFDSDGGSPVPNQTVAEGEAVIRPDNPTKVEDGIEFGFVNWYDNEECTEPHYDFDTSVTADITLYAKWSQTFYTVVFNSNGGSPVDDQLVGENGTASEPTQDPTRNGHKFGGWYGDSDLTEPYDFDTPVTGSITLYAGWRLNTYTVTFMDGGTVLSEFTENDVPHGSTVNRPATNPAKDGYIFDNWYANSALTTLFSFSATITANTTVYAKFNINTYTVTFMDGDTVLSALTKTVTHNSVVNRPSNPPKDGYIFHNWYADSGLTALFDFNNTPITEHTTVYAGWSGEEFAGALINVIFNVANASEWAAAVSDIIDNGNDKNYVINVTADFSVTGGTTNTFGGVSGVAVSLRGKGRVLTLNGNGSIVRTGGVQNIILRDLTLRGRDSNNSSLVFVNSGTFTMYGGEIFGNTTLNSGGGVFVNSGGTFIMYGGEIFGNTTLNSGGGVFINTGGTFRIVTGTIYGSGEAENVKNTAETGSLTGASLYRYPVTAHAQYGTFSDGEWGSNGNLNTTHDTIRVINGVLQPYFIGVRANGFPMMTTTTLTLTFSLAIPGLSAEDILLSGVYGVTKGQLGGPSSDGTRTIYLLPVSGFTEEGTLSVSVSKESYTVGGPRTAVVYYSSSYIFVLDTVSIPAGTFTMGSPENEPDRQPYGTDETQHEVTLSGFTMNKYQVTQELYEAVTGTTPSAFTPGGNHNYAPGVTGLDTANFPVEQVSWYDAIVFCNRLSMLGFPSLSPAYSINGSTDPDDWGPVPTSNNATWNAVQIVEGSNGYRLPTEAQWEYACRAGTWGDNYSAYNWGTNTINPTQANFDTRPNRTTDVGSYAPNAWGLYDMHGNVWEWCWDWYGTYPKEAQTDTTGPVSGNCRVTRGGSWGIDGEYLRSAFRDDDSGPFKRNHGIGFRVVKP
jgi:uncharacterized repeat protein (TIGR02543 family)